MSINSILNNLVINKKGDVYLKIDNKGTTLPYPIFTDQTTNRKYLKVGDEIIYHDFLVASIFVPNPNPDKFFRVEHIDGNIENDEKENLRWVE